MVLNGPYFWVPKPEAKAKWRTVSDQIRILMNSASIWSFGVKQKYNPPLTFLTKLQRSYDIWSTVLSQWSEQMTILILILQTDPWWVAMSHLYGFLTSPFSSQASLGGLGGTKQLTGKTSKRFFEGWASGWVTTLQCPVFLFVISNSKRVSLRRLQSNKQCSYPI